MNKKYELTDETKDGLHRIRALRDFVGVDAGDLGGFVASEENLSHEGDCWVYDNAEVSGDAEICGNATIHGNAVICGSAKVYGDSWIADDAYIGGDAKVGGDAVVSGEAKVYGKAVVYGNAVVCGSAKVCGDAEVGGDAEIRGEGDFIVYENIWSCFRHFTYTRSNKMWKVGCFYGNGNELIAKAYRDSRLSGRCYEAVVNLQRELDRIMDEEKAGA